MTISQAALLSTVNAGHRPENVEIPHVEGRNPSITDVNYPIGKRWVNNVNDATFSLTSITTFAGVSAANWAAEGGGTGLFPITPFVVGPSGQADYQTIQSAINAAVAAGGYQTVYIQPGTYTENLSVPANISLIAANGNLDINQSTKIIGTHSLNSTGFIKFQGLYLQYGTNANDGICTGSNGNGPVTFSNCVFNMTAAAGGYVFYTNSQWTGEVFVDNCRDVSTGINLLFAVNGPILATDSILGTGAGMSTFLAIQNVRFSLCVLGCSISSGGGTLTLIDCIFSDSQAGIATLNTGGLYIEGTDIPGGVNCLGSGTVLAYGSNFAQGVVGNGYADSGTVVSNLINCTIDGISHGSSSPMTLSGTIIDTANNPAIAGNGAGAIRMFGGGFQNIATVAGTLTFANSATLTSVVNTTAGAGTLTLHSTSAGSGSNAGYLQMLIGTETAYIPYFTNIAP